MAWLRQWANWREKKQVGCASLLLYLSTIYNALLLSWSVWWQSLPPPLLSQGEKSNQLCSPVVSQGKHLFCSWCFIFGHCNLLAVRSSLLSSKQRWGCAPGDYFFGEVSEENRHRKHSMQSSHRFCLSTVITNVIITVAQPPLLFALHISNVPWCVWALKCWAVHPGGHGRENRDGGLGSAGLAPELRLLWTNCKKLTSQLSCLEHKAGRRPVGSLHCLGPSCMFVPHHTSLLIWGFVLDK